MRARKKLISWAVSLIFGVTALIVVGQVLPAQAKPRAVYIAPNLSNVFDVVLAKNWQQKCQQLGIDAVVKSAENDSKREADEWDRAIAAKYDAIAGGPVDSSTVIASVKKANEAGVGVFMLGRTCSGGKVVLSSRADNVSLGTFAAEEVVRRLTKKYGEPKGLVLEIQGEMASTNARIRSESMNAVYKKYPKIRVISKPTHWLDSEFYDITKSVAATNPDLAAICMGSDVIYGVDAALDSLGKLKPIGDPDHIIIVGIDADPRILDLMRKGVWDASALQDAVGYGTILAQRMREYFEGKFEIKTSEFVLGDYDREDYRFIKMRGVISNPGKPDDGCPVYWTDKPEGWELMTPSRIIDKSNCDDPDLWGNKIKEFE